MTSQNYLLLGVTVAMAGVFGAMLGKLARFSSPRAPLIGMVAGMTVVSTILLTTIVIYGPA